MEDVKNNFEHTILQAFSSSNLPRINKKETFLNKISSRIALESNNSILYSKPKTGVFEISSTTFFNDNHSSSNFCNRNSVIVEFTRKANIPFKININYQYHQFINESKPFVKICGVCENGPCRHEYLIHKKSANGVCSVEFTIHAIFSMTAYELQHMMLSQVLL